MSEQLKPCPFCGGAASTWDDHRDFYVACYKCNIDMNHGKPEKAIEAWNRRTQPAITSESGKPAAQGASAITSVEVPRLFMG